MKKNTFIILTLLFFSLFCASRVKADVLPDDSHFVERCVKFVNLNDYPNIFFVGYYTGPMIKGYEAYQIKNNQCLTKGYKFNTFKVYSANKTKTPVLDLKNLDFSSLVEENITSISGYNAENDNSIERESVEYSVAGIKNDKPVIYISKKVFEYNDNIPVKIETFPNPLVLAKPAVVKPVIIAPAKKIEPVSLVKPIVPTSDVVVTSSENFSNVESQENIITTTEQTEKKLDTVNVDNKDGAPVKNSAKKGFWYSIVCFLKSLFGNKCG